MKELFDYELGEVWEGSALGVDALQHLFNTALNEFRPYRLVYDVGAGGFVVFALRVLGITAGGCEASTTLRDAANRIGSQYFGSVWEPIEATMRPVSSKVIVCVNNLAPSTQAKSGSWQPRAFRSSAARSDAGQLATASLWPSGRQRARVARQCSGGTTNGSCSLEMIM